MSKPENTSRNSGNQKQNVDKIPQKTKGKKKESGQTPEELMHKHLSNKSHVITDDDIKNLDLKIPDADNPSNQPLEIDESQTRPHDEDKDHRFKTPWDVIDE